MPECKICNGTGATPHPSQPTPSSALVEFGICETCDGWGRVPECEPCGGRGCDQCGGKGWTVWPTKMIEIVNISGALSGAVRKDENDK